MTLTDRVAIVTGAGTGIGKAAALALARAGAHVAAVDIDAGLAKSTADAVSQLGRRGLAVETDVGDVAAIDAMVRRVIAAFERIDVLVNNAGVTRRAYIMDLTEADWDRIMRVNAKGVFFCLQRVAREMIPRRSGVIINIASTSGLRFTGSAQVAYAATKAGVIQLSRVVAVQYAPKGIRVNTVVPGQLHTPMVEARLAHQRMGGDVQALLASRQKRIPLGYAGDGRDTANAVLFLASDEARFITGAELVVDGGMTVRCD